jgi:hypothetical protein
MTAFIFALVIGIATAAVYVGLAVERVGRVRRDVLAGARHVDHPSVYEGQGRGFTLKASLGAVASVLLLVGVSEWSWFWYVLPFLAIGSSLAVITAFLADER